MTEKFLKSKDMTGGILAPWQSTGGPFWGGREEEGMMFPAYHIAYFSFILPTHKIYLPTLLMSPLVMTSGGLWLSDSL